MARPAAVKAFFLLAAALLPAFSARAEPPAGEVAYSYYLISCADFLKHREAGAEGNYNNTADMFYVAGWLSAYNRLKPASGIPDDTTLDDIMLWLEPYCRKTPESNLEAGLFQFGDEVKARDEAAKKAIVKPGPPKTPFPRAMPPAAAPAGLSPAVPGLKPLPY